MSTRKEAEEEYKALFPEHFPKLRAAMWIGAYRSIVVNNVEVIMPFARQSHNEFLMWPNMFSKNGSVNAWGFPSLEEVRVIFSKQNLPKWLYSDFRVYTRHSGYKPEWEPLVGWADIAPTTLSYRDPTITFGENRAITCRYALWDSKLKGLYVRRSLLEAPKLGSFNWEKTERKKEQWKKE